MQCEWISVKDKLPELFELVLLYIPDDAPFQTVREGFLTPYRMWHAALYDRDYSAVTHWMPMPKPPKEDER